MLIPLSLGKATQLGPSLPALAPLVAYPAFPRPDLNYLHLESRLMLFPLRQGLSYMKG